MAEVYTNTKHTYCDLCMPHVPNGFVLSSWCRLYQVEPCITAMQARAQHKARDGRAVAIKPQSILSVTYACQSIPVVSSRHETCLQAVSSGVLHHSLASSSSAQGKRRRCCEAATPSRQVWVPRAAAEAAAGAQRAQHASRAQHG